VCIGRDMWRRCRYEKPKPTPLLRLLLRLSLYCFSSSLNIFCCFCADVALLSTCAHSPPSEMPVLRSIVSARVPASYLGGVDVLLGSHQRQELVATLVVQGTAVPLGNHLLLQIRRHTARSVVTSVVGFLASEARTASGFAAHRSLRRSASTEPRPEPVHDVSPTPTVK